MKKRRLPILFLALLVTGCTTGQPDTTALKPAEDAALAPGVTEEIPKTSEEAVETSEEHANIKPTGVRSPAIVEADWSNLFEGINGAAVIYDPLENEYEIYNQDLAASRRSPCSTFKIISSLTALENGVINSNDSTRTWSGEVFWNEDWNRDIGFLEAFRTSCVWYFREVIDEIGKDRMQSELDRLLYGNCDISDWEGRLNTNNNNRALTGFWIESSLKISPKEQTEVMERIFGDKTIYKEETLDCLKEAMLVSEQSEPDLRIYGKTGMGKKEGVVVDSWYTGFADKADRTIYFCVYLGETDGKEVSSGKAREIAVKIILDF